MKKSPCIVVALFLFLLKVEESNGTTMHYSQNATDTIIGHPLPQWQEGYLDIHAINTGRGESTLMIFPDGTTLLLDAAGSTILPTASIPPPAQKPNSQVSPGTAVSNYAKNFIKSASNTINYLMLSHFDPDHMGSYDSTLTFHSSGKFQKVGVTEVGSNLAFEKLIDRAYPSYDYPNTIKEDPRIVNYTKFIKWAQGEYNTKVEKFEVGSQQQIKLLNNPTRYNNFQIRNICANGMVWTGEGVGVKNTFPDNNVLVSAKASENIFSIGFVLSYGKFDYFTAGDLQYNGSEEHPWKDMESSVAKVVKEVDAMKANHHGTSNCNGEELLRKLNPNVIVIQPWRDVHPNPQTVERMFAANANSQIFTTNMTENNKLRLTDNLAKLKSLNGHVVIRVNPNGDEYNIYVLDDTNEEYKVSHVYGPYISK